MMEANTVEDSARLAYLDFMAWVRNGCRSVVKPRAVAAPAPDPKPKPAPKPAPKPKPDRKGMFINRSYPARQCQCGKWFAPSNGGSLSCSDECKDARSKLKHRDAEERRRRSIRPILPRACKECGKAFVPDDGRIKTCSDECLRVRKNRLDRVFTPVARVCNICGASFVARRYNALSCSKTCQAARLKEVNAAHQVARYIAERGPVLPRKCAACGVEFTPIRYRNMQGCSDQCRKALREQNNKGMRT